jgi:hypothetical protein
MTPGTWLAVFGDSRSIERPWVTGPRFGRREQARVEAPGEDSTNPRQEGRRLPIAKPSIPLDAVVDLTNVRGQG